MNKKNYIIATIIALLFCISCISNSDYVHKEFSWLLSEKSFLNQPSAGEENWYLIYKLSTEQLNDMLKNDFKNYKYQGWECYKGSCSIGNKKSIRIKGYSNKVMINLKKGSDSYNKVAMFIDLTEKQLILFYGITYGI